MTKMRSQTLYRFWSGDELLYIGITADAYARWRDHAISKRWWRDIDRVTVQHFDSRAAAMEAERAAIIAERPTHNVVHNQGKRHGQQLDDRYDTDGLQVAFWDRAGRQRLGGLQLYYEVDCDPISDDYTPDEISATELYAVWRRYMDRRGKRDFASIYWYVDGCGTFESAVPQGSTEVWSNYYTALCELRTGFPVKIEHLPVIRKRWRVGLSDKGGFIHEATGWTPNPWDPHVNLDFLDRKVAAAQEEGRRPQESAWRG